MTKITVLAKQDQSVLGGTESPNILLNQPSIVELDIKKEDILSSTREGNDAVILLKNGEKIVIANFFIPNEASPNSIVLKQSNGKLTLLDIDEKGQITDYRGDLDLKDIPSAQASLTTSVTEEKKPFDLPDFLEQHGPKVGLAVAIGLGVAMPLLDDGKSSNNTPKPPDTTKPDAPVGKLSEDGKKITGTAEANSTVILLDSAKTILLTVTADKNGNYEFSLPSDVQTGEIGRAHV